MKKRNPLTVVFKTQKGTIKCRLFSDSAPVTVANFINLSNRGYYNGLTFHRVIPDFMIQGGCPTGDGRGGPGYQFEDEFSSQLRHQKPGILSMANSGPQTNGSQFFITHVPTPWLDGNHTVFGETLSQSDQTVVDRIEQDDVIESITIKGDYADLFSTNQDRIDEWNVVLDQQ